MNTTTCPFPYTSTNCTETFAEVIETQYRIWQGLYGGFFGLFFLFASWQSIAIVHMNGLFPIDMQKLLLFLGNLGGLTLVIRAIDLYGWEDRVSIIVNGFMYDIGSCCCLSCLLIIVWSWYSFLSKATFQKRKNIGYIIFYRGSHILIWAIQLICCLFQYKVGVYYLSQALKMILITFILLFWLFGGVFFGYKIYAMLAAAEKKFGVPSDTTSKDASARKRSQKKKSSIRQHNSATPTPTPTPGSKSQNDLSQHASSSNNIHSNLNTASNNTQSTMHDDTEDEAQHNNVAVQDPEPGIRSKKRIKAIRKIYNLLKALLVIVFLCVAATTYSFITALSNKTDLDTNSFEPPVGFGDLISNGAFDIIQYVALCVVVINYRVTKLSISTTTKKAKAAAARALISFHQDNKKDPKAEDEDNRASYPMTENPTASSNVLLSNKSGLSINISTTRLDLSENESDDTKYRASFQAKMQEQKAQQQEQQQQQTQQKLEQKSEQPASVSPTSASASTNTDALSSTPMASSLLSGVPSPLSEADELRDVVLEIPQEVRDSTD